MVNITFDISSSDIFSMIGHQSSSYPRHISDDNFFVCFVVVQYFAHMPIISKPSSCIIYNQRSLDRNISNFVSGCCCIFTSIDRISSPCSLLHLFFYERKKFWRNSCSSIGTVSFGKSIFYIHIQTPNRNQVSLFE